MPSLNDSEWRALRLLEMNKQSGGMYAGRRPLTARVARRLEHVGYAYVTEVEEVRTRGPVVITVVRITEAGSLKLAEHRPTKEPRHAQ